VCKDYFTLTTNRREESRPQSRRLAADTYDEILGLRQGAPGPLVSRDGDRLEPLHLAYAIGEPSKTHATDGDPFPLGDKEHAMRAAVFALQRFELAAEILEVQGDIEGLLIQLEGCGSSRFAHLTAEDLVGQSPSLTAPRLTRFRDR